VGAWWPFSDVSGIESAGALAELYRANFARDYPNVPEDKARIEAGPTLIPMFKDDIRAYTEKALAKRSVEAMVGQAVKSISPTRVTLKSGTVIPRIRSCGARDSRVIALGLELGRGNRIAVGPELTVRDHPEMYAVGDIAAITDAKTKTVLPQLGSVALQSGEHAGETIARPIAGKATKPFKYRDKGTMATIGRGAAVLQMMGGRSVGHPAPRPAADQRGPGGSGRRLGGRRDDPPARRPDHGRDGRGARPGRSR